MTLKLPTNTSSTLHIYFYRVNNQLFLNSVKHEKPVLFLALINRLIKTKCITTEVFC